MRKRRSEFGEWWYWYSDAIWISLGVIVIACVIAFWGRSPERVYVTEEKNQCTLKEKVVRYDLDKVYCGKACFRDAVEYRYYCATENRNVNFVE